MDVASEIIYKTGRGSGGGGGARSDFMEGERIYGIAISLEASSNICPFLVLGRQNARDILQEWGKTVQTA